MLHGPLRGLRHVALDPPPGPPEVIGRAVDGVVTVSRAEFVELILRHASLPGARWTRDPGRTTVEGP